MRHIAVILASVSAAAFLAGCGMDGVELRLGMRADSGEGGPILGLVELPEGHPPVLPPGHPPLPPRGHPPVPGFSMQCPESDPSRSLRPEPGNSVSRDEPAIISI
jgi:hypothetical protein